MATSITTPSTAHGHHDDPAEVEVRDGAERKPSLQFSLGREESFLHFVAREGRWALYACIGLCVLGIVVVMWTPWFFVALVPATVMFISGALLIIARYVERRTDPVAHDLVEHHEGAIEHDVIDDAANADKIQPRAAHLIFREGRTGAVIVFVVVLAALLLAYIAFFKSGPFARMFPIAALVVFAYMLFIMAPIWLGWFNDDIEDETKRMDGEPLE